jgi:hypothetical protein
MQFLFPNAEKLQKRSCFPSVPNNTPTLRNRSLSIHPHRKSRRLTYPISMTDKPFSFPGILALGTWRHSEPSQIPWQTEEWVPLHLLKIPGGGLTGIFTLSNLGDKYYRHCRNQPPDSKLPHGALLCRYQHHQGRGNTASSTSYRIVRTSNTSILRLSARKCRLHHIILETQGNITMLITRADFS